MTVDLMLVDDDKQVLKAIETLAQLVVIRNPDELHNLNIIKFDSGLEALTYLKRNTPNLPRGYLVDMRMPYNPEELASPLQIYNFLKQNGAVEYFRFYTGHISEHDLKVQKETGAEILVKGKDGEKLERFLSELAKIR